MAPIDEKIRVGHLRWFDQVQRRKINTPVRRSELIQVEITKKDRGRPKITIKKQDINVHSCLHWILGGVVFMK